jgi:8-oxo-dGTP pyrophosphatase MutT (NUDIX family)
VPKQETAAGGVVFRRAGGAGESPIEVVLGEQRDRVSGELNVRLPKGKLDGSETPEQAAVREVREETGLASRVVEPLGSVSYTYTTKRGKAVPKEVHFFLMELAGGGAGAPDGEFGRVFWCPLEEAAERLSFATERDVMARAQKALGAH